jgi:hypothetical protein
MKFNITKISTILSSLIIYFCFILNSTNKSTFLILFLLFILMILNLRLNKNQIKSKLPLLFVFILCVPLSFTDNFLLNQFIRLLELLSLILLFPINFIPPRRFQLFLFIILGYLIFTQIGMTLNISSIKSFVDKFYPIDINYWGTNEYDSATEALSQLNNRLAGIYYNPNIMGQSILLLYVLLLIIILKEDDTNYKKLSIFSICLISITLSGSRTALITYILLNMYAYRKILLKYIIIVLPSFIIVFLYFIVKYKDEIRVLSNITNPFGDKEDSGGAKLEVLINHFKTYNYQSITEMIYLFFGKMNWDKQFDADPGYILSFFGILGTFVFVLYLIYLFFHLQSRFKFVFFILLISIGATIIMNFRFSILAAFIFSISYKNYKV